MNVERVVTMTEDFFATHPLLLYNHYIRKEDFLKIKLPCRFIGEKDGVKEYVNDGYHIYFWWETNEEYDTIEIKVVGPDGITTETGGLIVNVQ